MFRQKGIMFYEKKNNNMKIHFYLTLLLCLLVCSCKQNKPTTAENTETDLSVQTATDTIPKMPEMPIHPRFLSLIQHIDTSGYIFDTLRYNRDEPCKIIQQDKYVLFEIPKETTAPFEAFMFKEEDEKEIAQHKEDTTDYIYPPYYDFFKDFDIKPFEKTQKVVLYYFKKKQPQIIGGEKWYPDGVIEEWTFANQEEAQKATVELMNAELCVMYFNTCAFVCCAERNMYIFYSRAAAFMYEPQNNFYKWFVTKNPTELKTSAKK